VLEVLPTLRSVQILKSFFRQEYGHLFFTATLLGSAGSADAADSS